MKRKVLILLLVFAGIFLLVSGFSGNGGHQIVCGTVRTDFIKSAEHGLKTHKTESYEDKPACLMVNVSTGEAWIYVHEVKVHTTVTGVTRETVFQGFKKLDMK